MTRPLATKRFLTRAAGDGATEKRSRCRATDPSFGPTLRRERMSLTCEERANFLVGSPSAIGLRVARSQGSAERSACGGPSAIGLSKERGSRRAAGLLASMKMDPRLVLRDRLLPHGWASSRAGLRVVHVRASLRSNRSGPKPCVIRPN
jgi:hypothetical protein